MIKRKIINWLMPAILQALVKQIHSNPALGIEIERIARRILREQQAQTLSRKAQQKQ